MAPTYIDLHDLNHDPGLARALGNLLIVWAGAETELVRAFAAVCNLSINHAHFGYYRIPTFDSRTKVIRALLAEWKTTKYKPDEIAKVVTHLSRLSKTRNDWVHGVWSKDEKTQETVIFDFRAAEDKGRMKTVKAADVLNHVQAVYTQMKILRRLLPGIREHDDDP